MTPASGGVLGVAEGEQTLSEMLDRRRKWLASAERTLELLAPEWVKFEAREGHDIYVARMYADHFSEARTHRKEIAALELSVAALRSAAEAAREKQS